jgi:Lrp/AsnC family transcriptional regulator, leucine-responsive regulatory protein
VFPELDPQRLGIGLLALVECRSTGSIRRLSIAFARRWPGWAKCRMGEVQERHTMAGGFDYPLKVRVTGMTAYRRFLGDRVSVLPGVNRTHTYFVMEETKATQEIPVGTLKVK